MSPYTYATHGALTTHLMCPLMFSPIYRGWALSAVSFTISQSSRPIAIFSCVFANFSFKGIIGDPLKNFDFLVSIYDSNLVFITFFMLFSVALFVEYFWVRKFLLLSENVIVIRRWGSSDDATGGMWGVPS